MIENKNPIQAFFRARPLVFALLLIFAYVLWFTLPSLLAGDTPGEGRGIETASDIILQMLPEIGLVVSIVAMVALLHGWKTMRVTSRLSVGWYWAVIPPIIYIGLFLFSGALMMNEANVPVTNLPMQVFGPLIITTFFVGIFEEFLFRGVVFRAFEIWRGAILAVVASSLLFGFMHYVNWVSGQSLAATHWQVAHAAMAGLLYVGILLKTGSIWPSVLIHGAWDSTVIFVTTARSFSTTQAATEGGGGFTQAAIYGFEPLFGALLVYFWWRQNKRIEPQA